MEYGVLRTWIFHIGFYLPDHIIKMICFKKITNTVHCYFPSVKLSWAYNNCKGDIPLVLGRVQVWLYSSIKDHFQILSNKKAHKTIVL
jgi:hypothetical protein